jgi:hypothetical protein
VNHRHHATEAGGTRFTNPLQLDQAAVTRVGQSIRVPSSRAQEHNPSIMIGGTGSRPGFFLVRRIARHLLWTGALLAVVLTSVSSASAAKSCAQKVIDDWYGDGRLGRVYSIKCYRAALKILPVDAEVYSNAPEVIRRALQNALRAQQQATAPPSPPPAETTSEEPPDEESVPPAGNDPGDPPSPNPNPPLGSAPPGGTEAPGRTQDTGAGNGVLGEAVDSLGSGSANSIPVPLLIIGGLALLLLAAGGAGLVARRLNARKGRPESFEPPGGGVA